VGPSVGDVSLLLSVVDRCFNGQSFTLRGYLPIEKKARQQDIMAMEKVSFEKNRTQSFRDTPYRNEQLLNDLIKVGRKDTFLCIAKDITGPQEQIIAKPIGKWKTGQMKLHKTPAIFMIYSQ